MKYIFFDTNIYINMIVNRRNDIDPSLISNFALLVEAGGIGIILPEIVEYETYKHLEEEIYNIEKMLKKQIRGIEELYWLTGFQIGRVDIEAHKRRAKKPLRELLDVFERQRDQYITEVQNSLGSIFQSGATEIVMTSDELLCGVLKRKLFKRAPMHKECKEAYADALITEILVNVGKYIELTNNDTVYFVTENYTDFALDKQHRNIFHPHIDADLERAGLHDKVKMLNSFALLISTELKDEIKAAHMEEAFQEYAAMDEDLRDMVGLPPLSGYQLSVEEFVSDYEDTQQIIGIFEEIGEELCRVENLYAEYDEMDLLDFGSLDEKQREQLKKEIAGIVATDDFEEGVLALLNKLEESYPSFPDYLQMGEDIKVEDPEHKAVRLYWDNTELSPESGEQDTVCLCLERDSKKLAESYVTVTYGFLELDDDGNVADANGSDIEVDFSNVINKLRELREEYRRHVDELSSVLSAVQGVFTKGDDA